MSNQQRTRTGCSATFAKHTGRWSRGLFALLAVSLGLQASLAQAQTVYYHNDVAGSPVAATDETGNLLWRESYRPYGDRMLRPAAANTQWFHGKQLDPDTAIEDFGARNYDPVLGRFLSIDPVDFQDKNIHSFNRYAYGNNNPVKYKDPDGRIVILVLRLFAFGMTVVGLGDEVSMPGGGLAKAGGKAVGGAANAAVKAEGAAAQSVAKGPAEEAADFAVRFHHPYPQYLGGKFQQLLEPLPKALHDAYHSGLDKVLPRQIKGGATAFYDSLSATEKAAILRKFESFTKEFDRIHGTSLWEGAVREGVLAGH